MPIPNKRVAVLGIKAAEREWDSYARARVIAERESKVLDRELRDMQIEAERFQKEVRDG